MNEIKFSDPALAKDSLVETPSADQRQLPTAHPYILFVAQAAQTVTPWGRSFRQRDKELRSFWHAEPWLASVVYSVSIRNASFAWDVNGSDPSKPQPKNTISRVKQILKNSDRGNGWISLITKTCIDLYSQDNAAFWEIIRVADNPAAPVVNISHLDSARCQRTGDPQFPVIYTDLKGGEHILKYYQVRSLEEFPSPVEEAFNVQYCAVSRCLLAAEIIQSISVYKQEKVGGTFTKAIDVVSGLTQQNIDDALALAEEQNLNKGLYRYSLPVIVPGVDPTSTLSHVHIDLASLPENFSEDESFKWYVAQLAAAFGVDYQEIAPLMTGNLGSSQQSEIMHLKTRGKGPALIMGLIENIINNGLIPGNVEFRFLEQDIRSEREKAETRYRRGLDRAMRVKVGELDGRAARQIAILDGDLPLWLANELDDRMPDSIPQTPQEFQPDQIEGGMEREQDQEILP